MRYMLDTNVCIHVMRDPDGKVAAKFRAHVADMSVSTVTLHELIHGADKSRRPAYQRGLVMDLISKVNVIEFNSDAADHSGNIHATLAKAGNIIGAYDMLIAGHARSLGMTVVTTDLDDFTRVDGLRCEDWT